MCLYLFVLSNDYISYTNTYFAWDGAMAVMGHGCHGSRLDPKTGRMGEQMPPMRTLSAPVRGGVLSFPLRHRGPRAFGSSMLRIKWRLGKVEEGEIIVICSISVSCYYALDSLDVLAFFCPVPIFWVCFVLLSRVSGCSVSLALSDSDVVRALRFSLNGQPPWPTEGQAAKRQVSHRPDAHLASDPGFLARRGPWLPAAGRRAPKSGDRRRRPAVVTGTPGISPGGGRRKNSFRKEKDDAKL